MKITTLPNTAGERKLIEQVPSIYLSGVRIESILLDRKDMQNLQVLEENSPGELAAWFARMLMRFGPSS